jgi:hypothetical protein
MRQLGLQNFAHLIDDVSKPAFYRRPLTETNLWISQAGCVSALHFDFLDNLLCQIKGHKTITLYAPAQTAELYPAFACPEQTDFMVPPLNFSLVDFNTENFPGAFPLEKVTQPAGVIKVSPGDILYIPPYWWHRVETTLGPFISVNFWYAAQYGGPYSSEENAREIAFLNSFRELESQASPHMVHAWENCLRALGRNCP